MRNYATLYIDGAWTPSTGTQQLDVVEACTEEVFARIPEGTAGDVDRAVAAAREAFEPWAGRSVDERADYLARISEGRANRTDEIAEIIAREVGMPLALSKLIQAGLPTANLGTYAALVRPYTFDEQVGNSLVLREPVGVVGCITPWTIGCTKSQPRLRPRSEPPAASCSSRAKSHRSACSFSRRSSKRPACRTACSTS